MTAFSIHDRITGWVDDQIAKEDPLDGDEWGRHVTMAALQTQQGDAIVWVILITIRGPFLGEDVIGSMVKLQANIPPNPQCGRVSPVPWKTCGKHSRSASGRVSRQATATTRRGCLQDCSGRSSDEHADDRAAALQQRSRGRGLDQEYPRPRC